MRTCWHKHKRKTISQSASTNAYVNDVLTEHKHKHKKKAYAYAYVAAVLTSAQASYAYVYAYACVTSVYARDSRIIKTPSECVPFCNGNGFHTRNAAVSERSFLIFVEKIFQCSERRYISLLFFFLEKLVEYSQLGLH